MADTIPTSPASHTPAVTSAPRPGSRAASFALRPLPGVVGALVLVKRPADRLAPSVITDAFEREILAALASGAILDAGPVLSSNDHALADRFLASLPETVTPVAALGTAVKAPGSTSPDHRWQHVRTAEKGSRWTYCAAHVSEHSVSIHGSHSAEVDAHGTLTIDADVPPPIATALRAAYDAARGVVESSRVLALVTAHLVRVGGRPLTSDVFLLPLAGATTCGVLAGLCALDGWADVVPVADPERIARLSTPVTRSLEEQIADVVAATQEFVAKAAAAAAPDGGVLQERTVDGVRQQIADARAAVELWGSRLALGSLDVAATLDALDVAADRADKEAQAALEERRAAKRAERAAKAKK